MKEEEDGDHVDIENTEANKSGLLTPISGNMAHLVAETITGQPSITTKRTSSSVSTSTTSHPTTSHPATTISTVAGTTGATQTTTKNRTSIISTTEQLYSSVSNGTSTPHINIFDQATTQL